MADDVPVPHRDAAPAKSPSTSGVALYNLPRWTAGPHKVFIELVNANHQPLEKGVVTFVVPDVKAPNCHR